MHNIKYKNYRDFKAKVKSDICNSIGHLQWSDMLFRGQSNSTWSLKSSFDRIEKDKSKFDYLIKEFRSICRYYNYNEELLNNSEFDQNLLIAFGQHYGLPTRLLDWTSSYYCALFFAISGVNPSNDGEFSIWAINQKSQLEKQSQGLDFVTLNNNKFNSRIINQHGHFSISRHSEDSIDQYETNILRKHGIDDLLWKIDVKYKKEEVLAIINDLSDMGITYSVIYPDIEGFIKESIFKMKIS